MIVLDTHAWIWWVSSPELLSDDARGTIQAAADSGQVYVSSISVWEVAMLAKRGRLELTIDVEDWIRHCETLPELYFVPVNNSVALRSVQIPDFASADPADRIIVATALTLGTPLVTKDERMQAYSQVTTVW